MTACSVQPCEKKAHARGLCPMHYQRLRTRGETGSPDRERAALAGLVCVVERCGQPRRKVDWCAAHYSQVRRIGEARPFVWKWAEPGSSCVVCDGQASLERGLRRYCSDRCRALLAAHEGSVPTEFTCIVCFQSTTLEVRSAGGYRRRADSAMCPPCRKTMRLRSVTWRQIASEDGDRCGICGEQVDLDMVWPDLLHPSIDHIVPKALGGTHDRSNLQLAHFLCNVRKGRRLMDLVGGAVS
jgi:5-methylcytosine-specific restriction endonuclease McrA